MKRRVVLNEARDFELLTFLWRWKVLTTNALAHRFFPDASLGRAYKRLCRLEKGKFIRSILVEGAKNWAWTLDRKGFEIIRSRLPPLAQVGFKSESPGHDLIASAVHLGEWLRQTPPGVELFSEQELRCVEAEAHPEWVPKILERRPDGYWALPSAGGTKVIALEVERSRQTQAHYKAVAEFYRANTKIMSVLWVLDETSRIKILSPILNAQYKPQDSFHNFVGLKEFKASGWFTEIAAGNHAGRSIANLLGYTVATSRVHVPAVDLLNPLKSPHRSSRYAKSVASSNLPMSVIHSPPP